MVSGPTASMHTPCRMAWKTRSISSRKKKGAEWSKCGRSLFEGANKDRNRLRQASRAAPQWAALQQHRPLPQ